MCGRYTLTAPMGTLWGRFGLREEDVPYKPRYNIAPTQSVLTITNEAEPRFEFMRWGLIPFWAKDEKIGSRMVNARAETVATSNAFRVPFRRKRCLILADGFYELKRDEKSKTPMRIVLKSAEPFAFAGLWEEWTPPGTGVVRSCTIITTNPNALIEPIHNRMPVILTPEDEAIWLDGNVDDPAMLAQLLTPFAEDDMAAYPVSSLVNAVRNDVPDCILPLR